MSTTPGMGVGLGGSTGTRGSGNRFASVNLGATEILIAVILCLAVVSATIPDKLAPYDPNEIAVGELLDRPTSAHWLGTDELGRDLFSRIIHGARMELVVSVVGVALAIALGLPLGLVSGYRGGMFDEILMRVMDALMAFPAILFAILVVAGMGTSDFSIVLTVGIVYLPRFARLIRGTVLVLKENDFVLAAQSYGATETRIMVRHILPNCIAPILVLTTLAMAAAILIEAALSYLGLGVQPPTPTWGNLLQHAQSYPAQAPWYVFAPGVSIFLLVLALNMLGDRLRDALDPRLRSV